MNNNYSASQNNSQTAARKLREWQILAIRHFFALLKQFFLITATPGGGKTEVACQIARRLLIEGRIERVLVVVPTDQLKRQWAECFARFGIQLDPEWRNNWLCEAADFQGIAATYAQIGSQPEIFEVHCRQKGTFVILDELHHSADGLTWGDSLRTAFANCRHILGLSGTPFRSDNYMIPFVRYADGKSQSDYSYPYGAALADGVVRPVFFLTVAGKATWLRRNGDEVSYSLLDDTSSEISSELMRAVLSCEGDWLPFVLRAANDKITEFRERGHQTAAGLIVARDHLHAKEIAKRLFRETGETATVVTCDDPRAAQLIREFARPDCQTRWIIAVKMITEGIDIARIRTCVFATNVMSELHFRQVVGRIIRVIPELETQEAVMFLPANPILIDHALAIKTEREHVLARNLTKSLGGVLADSEDPLMNCGASPDGTGPITFAGQSTDDAADGDSDGVGQETISGSQTPDIGHHGDRDRDSPSGRPNIDCRNSIVLISSEAEFHHIVFDGKELTEDELRRARAIAGEMGLAAQPEVVAAILRHLGHREPAGTDRTAENPDVSHSAPHQGVCADECRTPDKASETPIITLSERKKLKRQEINRLVNKLAHRRGVKPDEIHREWLRSPLGGTRSREATEAELDEKLAWVKQELSTYMRTSKKGGRGV